MARAAIVLAACVLYACTAKPISYEEEIGSWRAEKDRYMRSADSPVPAEKRRAFPPLLYFAISQEYRVPAALTPSPGGEVIQLDVSTGRPRNMRRAGTLEFTLQGQRLSLTAFADVTDTDMRRLFVPFSDLTSGTETYKGGRYLEMDRTATGIYDLDFNRAYHPFCVFNPNYECPLPPRENRLKVPIRAGEKLPAS
jgi:hypothetical protein